MKYKLVIGLTPIGNIDRNILIKLSEKIKLKFNAEVKIKSSIEPPEDAYNPFRKQYYSTKILYHLLDALSSTEIDKILGVTDVDLYVPRLNFVFGEALCPGKVALISLFRLNPNLYSEKNGDKLLERTIKEAVHELGHTFGLMHCENSTCVMFFSNSLFDTDKKTENFCVKCKEKLEGKIK
ncbi:MAG: archaemetzincin family Zn-dependent metalloprotease [Candidatus Bathyarchaeia archaeon]|nr:archaemetzincin family Zn-dependent metalloprotease [Candidatus Bathyarchaeota archaeon]